MKSGHFFHHSVCRAERVRARDFYVYHVPRCERSYPWYRPGSSPPRLCEPENGPFFESTTRFSKYSDTWLDSTHARRDEAESRVVYSASMSHSMIKIRSSRFLGWPRAPIKTAFFSDRAKRGGRTHFESSSQGEGEWGGQWWLKTTAHRAPPRPTKLLGHRSPPLGCHTKKPI